MASVEPGMEEAEKVRTARKLASRSLSPITTMLFSCDPES